MHKATAVVLLLAAVACAHAASAAASGTTPNTQRSLKGFFMHHMAKQSYYNSGPAAPAPVPAPAPANVANQRPGIIGLKMDLLEALRCQKVYHFQYGSDPNRLRAALGPACQESTLNPIQCCTDSVALLNGPDLRGCICNHIVYSQLCGQLNVAGQNCDTLLPTLKSCGLQC